jgi:A/G-specific adenine glycosylase
VAPRPDARGGDAPAPDGGPCDDAVAMTSVPVPADFSRLALAWYAENGRDLPWRRPGATPWAVLVSEFMLQQTPVARVVPVWTAWLTRWPSPAALAAEPSGEAVRMWGRLGYPRRALRLHAAAVAIADRYEGAVPASYDALRSLPGVGDYTAAAVASFAFGARHAVVDTNVRRVYARAVTGRPDSGHAVTAAERRLAESLVPEDRAVAARYAVAVMEVGAVVCTARAPRCEACPLLSGCAWHRAGRPGAGAASRRPQAYAGTDREARGRLLAVLRDSDGAVPGRVLDAAWGDQVQRERALAGLLADGLAVEVAAGSYALP